MMRLLVDWETFHLKHWNQETIYVLESNNNWHFITQDNNIIIECIVEKKETVEENIIFSQTYLAGQNNLERCFEIIEPINKEDHVEFIEEEDQWDSMN